MQRLQRRVKDSHSQQTTIPNNVAKTKTFDRRTFLECSSRMKRLVPTLSRRQDNVHAVTLQPPPRSIEESEMSTFGGGADEDESSENDVKVIDTTKMKPVKEYRQEEPTCETQLVVQKKSSVSLILNAREQRSTLEVDSFGIHTVTLPRNPVAVNIFATTSGTSATLPPVFTTAAPKRKSNTGRRVWLKKPLTSLVTFMSNIGGNIDITSYPTP